MLKIEIDKHLRKVVVGAYSTEYPLFNSVPFNDNVPYDCFKNRVLEANGIEPEIFSESDKWKKSAQYYADRLGCRFNYRFRGALYLLWIKDYEQLISRFCRHKGKLDDRLILKFYRSLELINQAIEDKLSNIIPAIMFTNSSPRDIRKKLGRGCWRRLCANSSTRNKAIFSYMSKDIESTNDVDIIRTLSQLPTTMIRRRYDENFDDGWHNRINWVANALINTRCITKKVPGNPFETFEEYYRNLYVDTEHMAHELNMRFTTNWSLKRMLVMHDQYSRTMTKHAYSNHPFKHIDRYPQSTKYGTVTASLLRSPMDLAVESQEMNHCVVSYIDRVSTGDSILYALHKNNGSIRSTLELHKTSRSRYSMVQHRGRFNAPVEDNELQLAANYVLEEVNKRDRRQEHGNH